MRCPSCDHDLPHLKPEVIVQKEKCVCGLTDDVRIVRMFIVAAIALILVLFAGCWIHHHYNSRLAVTGWGLDINGNLEKVDPAPDRAK